MFRTEFYITTTRLKPWYSAKFEQKLKDEILHHDGAVEAMVRCEMDRVVYPETFKEVGDELVRATTHALFSQ